MPDLPGGTATFLLTDVENNTRLWEQFPTAMRDALARHDALAQECSARCNGTLVKPRGEGDSHFVVFARATDAVQAALELQQALHAEQWALETPIKVRMALHTGEAELRDNDYYGNVVNRCARIRATAYGGQVLLSSTTADLVREHLPPNVTLQGLGLHRLKDLQRPEALWQLRHPHLPATFAPLKSLDLYKHNLPRQLTSFISREPEIQQVKTLLAQTSLLTITGSGGCGKTRLALQVAAEIVETFPDGVWLVELALLPDSADVDAIVKSAAAALHVKEQTGQEMLRTLCEYLGSQNALLLLDNCEHVERAVARVVRALLLACPNLRILATSRHFLSIPGETDWRVPSLLVPAKNVPLKIKPEEALRYEAVRLFSERAVAVLPTFRLTTANLPHIVQICRRLDGIPLAIELAAARVSALSVKQIADRLDQAFRLLESDDAPNDRHRTLRAMIDWSHTLLKEPEKALLRRLSVFVGGWTLEACEAVCAWGELDHWEIVNLLTRLVHTSLVNVQDVAIIRKTGGDKKGEEESEEGEEEVSRYYLLETLRQFGQKKLEEHQETEQARDSHISYFLGLAEQAEPELSGSAQAHWLQLLETEHDNLRAALKWSVNVETRLRIAAALSSFWSRRYVTEGRGWLRGGLERSNHISPALRAKALCSLADLAALQQDYTTALPLFQQSYDLYVAIGDESRQANILSFLGTIARDQGDIGSALNYYQQSLEIKERVKDRRGVAAALNNLGMIARDQNDLETARDYYSRSLQIYRELSDTARSATVLNNLGSIEFEKGHYPAARDCYHESLTAFQELGDRWGIALALSNLGNALQRLGETAQAGTLVQQSLRIRHELDDRLGIAFGLCSLAQLARVSEMPVPATRLFAAATGMLKTLNAPLPPPDQAEIDQEFELLRNALGEISYNHNFNEAYTLSLEQIMLDALHLTFP